ncbi:MAG: hypothetical protein AAF684_10790, partial [Pseudomonadota bacterium]
RERDVEGFREAVEAFAKYENEIVKIESGEAMKPDVIQKRGQEYAAAASGAIAALAVVAIGLYIVITRTG